LKPCTQCGASNPDDAKTCVKCGLPLSSSVPEPAEKLIVDEFIISERGLSIRVSNAGTAPMTVIRVFRRGMPTPILGISSGNGTLEGGNVTIQPGSNAALLTEMPDDAVSETCYEITVVTAAGSRRTLTLTWP
jgi:hypothetical protein